MKLSPRHGFVTLSIGPLGNNWFTDLGNFHMLTHFILPYHTITVVNITISMFKSEKYLNIGGPFISWWRIQVFWNSTFCWKLGFLSLAMTFSCFSWCGRLSSFIFKKMPAKYSSLNNRSVSVGYFFKRKWCFMEKVASSACSSTNCTNVFPWDNDHNLEYSRSIRPSFVTGC